MENRAETTPRRYSDPRGVEPTGGTEVGEGDGRWDARDWSQWLYTMSRACHADSLHSTHYQSSATCRQKRHAYFVFVVSQSEMRTIRERQSGSFCLIGRLHRSLSHAYPKNTKASSTLPPMRKVTRPGILYLSWSEHGSSGLRAASATALGDDKGILLHTLLHTRVGRKTVPNRGITRRRRRLYTTSGH